MEEETQVVKNGRSYLLGKERTIILGISPGNPFFYNMGNLQKVLEFAKNNTEQTILLFLVDKISEHNYKAVGSKNPEKSARVKANRLRNKCQEAIRACKVPNIAYINWIRDVEPSSFYIDAFNYVTHLYENNHIFRTDIRESTLLALVSLKNGREKNMSESSGENEEIDVNEGVKYLLKELAFFSVVPDIYEACQDFVFVYHRRWPVLERFFDGEYDNISRPFLGLHVVE